MKNIAVTLMGTLFGLLLLRYCPSASGEALVEYVRAACLSSRTGRLRDRDAVNLVHT